MQSRIETSHLQVQRKERQNAITKLNSLHEFQEKLEVGVVKLPDKSKVLARIHEGENDGSIWAHDARTSPNHAGNHFFP